MRAHIRSISTRSALLFSTALLTLGACAADSDDGWSEEAATEMTAVADTNEAERAERGAEEVPGAPATDFGSIGRDVIVEMNVTMTSDDIARSVSAIGSRAAALGGGVASSDIDYSGGDGEGYAYLVLKVPTASVDAVITSLDEAGTVRSMSQSAQDVTDQLVDLDVRIDNARASVDNVREFMDRADDLTDLIALEGELTRRQTDLERLEAQQRNLADRVALATISIQIVPVDAVPEPDDTSIVGGLRQGWTAFVEFVNGVAYGIAVLLPFLVLAAIGALVARRIVRRVRNRQAATRPDRTTNLPPPSASENDDSATPTA